MTMAILTTCCECGAKTATSASNPRPLCIDCMKKHGWKPWEEMTLEEKVEDLDKRLKRSEAYYMPIG